ncbi:hypothetical protein Cantr_08030 [Candida viswanathii]|uniref:Uncharacterized protein n=1 Tax=Candida viswanathii TaxID=5486 RepID=A0A367Y391_9ASCO|nr:hypothetical protein Cantr_08030 [Candida viswanathii]
MFKEYSKFHTCDQGNHEAGDDDDDEDEEEEEGEHGEEQDRRELQRTAAAANASVITQHLLRLSKLLEFENISMTRLSSTPAISLKDFDNPQEFYKLLVNYNHLVELIICKNNELNVVKFRCHEIIHSLVKQVNQEQASQQVPCDHHPRNQPMKMAPNSADEICKKLQDIFNPKEEFDSTL